MAAANGGLVPDYNELANAMGEFVQADLPPMDLSGLQDVPPPPRRMPLSTPGA